MWILVLMTVANAVLKQYGFINVNRLSIGVIQIGVVEILLGLGMVWALIRGGAYRSRFPTPTSPIYIVLMLSCLLGILFGMLGAMRNDCSLKDALSNGREFGSIAICCYVGYRLLATPESAKRYALLAAFAGVLTGTLQLVGFGEHAEEANLANNINPLRGVILDFNSEYAAVTALLLTYCVVMGLKLLPRTLMILLAIYAFIGYICTLSRTSSLVCIFGILMSYWILPPGKRVSGMLKAAAFGVVIALSIFGSLLFADAVVGRDFQKKVEQHFKMALPGAESGTEPKAYDARFAAYRVELGLWLENPLMGQGFGIEEAMLRRNQLPIGPAYSHNGITATLCKTGIFGLIGGLGTIVMLMYMGWRITRQATERNDLIIGGLSLVTGAVYFVRACCTMAFTNRAALCFGLTAGVVLRFREMQRAKIAALREYEAQSPQELADHAEWEYEPEYGVGHSV